MLPMRARLTKVCACLIGSLCAAAAHAVVIEFEPPFPPVPRFSPVINAEIYTVPPAPAVGGYQSVLDYTGSSRALYNPNAASPADLFWNPANPTDTFDFNSFVIAGAWGNQTLTVEGWTDGAVLFSRLLPVTTAAFQATFNWQGIDQLRIIVGTDFVETVQPGLGVNRVNWTLDNLVINEAAVSEPAMLALLGLALAGLGFARRRKLH